MSNLITLSRTALYELVWTKPVRDIASDFGISDVALAKRCRALKIPVPPRGYWARVEAGQKPRRPSLPPFSVSKHAPRPSYVTTEAQADSTSAASPPTVTVTFTPRPAPPPPAPDAPISPAEAALRARIDALEIAPLDTLLQAHPAVLRTAVHLKHLTSRDITWPRGTRSGPLLTVTNVSDAQIDRALRVLDAVLRASAALGWHFTAPSPQEPPTYRGRGSWGPTPAAPPLFGHLLVDGEPLQLKIDERRRQFNHVPTPTELADTKAAKKTGSYVWMPRFDFEPSGELRLHLFDADSRWVRKTWKDTKITPARNSSKQDPARPARSRARAQARPGGATPARHRPTRTRASASARPPTTRRPRPTDRSARDPGRRLAPRTIPASLPARSPSRVMRQHVQRRPAGKADRLPCVGRTLRESARPAASGEHAIPTSSTNAHSRSVPTTSGCRKNCSASPATPGNAPRSCSPAPTGLEADGPYGRLPYHLPSGVRP